MWNDAPALSRLANLGFAVAILLVAYAAASRIANSEAFALREIRVVGAIAHVTRSQVEDVVHRQFRGNFFTLDLAHVRAAFEKLPWVRRVDVRRDWPAAIEVAIEEHQPFARWGGSALVNVYGEIFEGASNRRLPVFSGPQGSASEVVAHFAAFRRTLAAIGRDVDEVQLSERRAWRLRLDDGTVIELGREMPLRRLEDYATTFHRSVALLDGGSAYVDLRYANGFAVRIKGMNWSEKRA